MEQTILNWQENSTGRVHMHRGSPMLRMGGKPDARATSGERAAVAHPSGANAVPQYSGGGAGAGAAPPARELGGPPRRGSRSRRPHRGLCRRAAACGRPRVQAPVGGARSLPPFAPPASLMLPPCRALRPSVSRGVRRLKHADPSPSRVMLVHDGSRETGVPGQGMQGHAHAFR